MTLYRSLGALLMAVSTSLLAATDTVQPGPDERNFSWTAGLGLASLSFPAYRGSKVRETLALPVPVVSFTSRNFSLSRDGAKVDVFDSQRIHFNLSAAGSLPVDSDDVPLRDGMPDLNPSIELGPALIVELPCWRNWTCLQETQARGVVASDFSQVDTIGWTLHPRINLRRNAPVTQRHRHEFEFTAGPVYATRRYHEYFYAVPDEYATEQRPAYQARSGFSGWRFSLTHVYKFGNIGIYSYAAYDNLRDSAFVDSPLLETKDYILGGIMMRWVLWGSDLSAAQP